MKARVHLLEGQLAADLYWLDGRYLGPKNTTGARDHKYQGDQKYNRDERPQIPARPEIQQGPATTNTSATRNTTAKTSPILLKMQGERLTMFVYHVHRGFLMKRA